MFFLLLRTALARWGTPSEARRTVVFAKSKVTDGVFTLGISHEP